MITLKLFLGLNVQYTDSNSINDDPEERLVQRARKGDDAAYSELVVKYTPRLYGIVRRMVSDSLEAEAIVQEAFLRAWQSLRNRKNSPPDKRPFFSFLVTIALNLGRDQWRRDRFLDFGELEEITETIADREPGIEEVINNAETLASLAKAVEELPPAYRMVIALRYDADMKYDEIANILNLPVNTVRTHLRRAKEQLRNTINMES
jgi:RNA polymerase sigma-70 factor (ECF subfamily)